MGADLLLSVLAVDTRQPPRWEEAEAYLSVLTSARLAPAQIPDALKHYLEDWMNIETPEDPEGQEWADWCDEVAEVGRGLLTDLQEVRDVVEERVQRRDVAWLHVRGVRLLVSGGMSWGDSPTELAEQLDRLAYAGVFHALGEPACDGEDWVQLDGQQISL